MMMAVKFFQLETMRICRHSPRSPVTEILQPIDHSFSIQRLSQMNETANDVAYTALAGDDDTAMMTASLQPGDVQCCEIATLNVTKTRPSSEAKPSCDSSDCPSRLISGVLMASSPLFRSSGATAP